MHIHLYKPDHVFQAFLNLPGVKIYDPNKELGSSDKIIFGKYWHLQSMESIKNKDFVGALHNINFAGEEEFLMTPEIFSFLKLPQSVLIFYNEYETNDLITDSELIDEFVTQMFNLPGGKILFSTSDYWNHLKLFNDNFLSYDWVLLREKRDFDQKNIVDFHVKKKFRILSLNRRPSWERYRYCAYLNEYFPEITKFSYLSYGIEPTNNNFMTMVQMDAFNWTLPRDIDGFDPKWESLDGLLETLEQTYFLTIFETNAEQKDSAVQQVSEKTYKGIKSGKPFLVFTTKGGILQHLKNLGFKTFAPFISEAYDNPELPYEIRYSLLLSETKRLCTIPDSELVELYNQLETIIVHNLEQLRSTENIPNFFAFMPTSE